MTQSRTLLIIGGTGFFGKSLLDSFARGLLAPFGVDRVIAAARRPAVLRDTAPELLGPRVTLLRLHAETVDRLPPADIVIHAANTSDARRYHADPRSERDAIVAMAERFVAVAARSCPHARIVYASSGAVYGPQPAALPGLRENAAFADTAGLPAYKRDYAEAKRRAERAIVRGGAELGLAVSIARGFAFVGPYLPRDQHFAVGNFLTDGLAGRTVMVEARHEVVRSYLHADDLARWLLTIAEAATPACPTFNVGSDEAIEIAELARRVAQRFGVGVALAHRAEGVVDRYVPDIARAARALALVPQRNLDAALDATIAQLRGEPKPAALNLHPVDVARTRC